MGWKKRNQKLTLLTEKFSQEGRLLEKKDEDKVKGGKVRKYHIWVGAGGITPD